MTNRKISLFIALTAFLATGNGWAAEPLPWEAPAPFKTGAIEYTVKGTRENPDGVKGTMTLHFAGYGKSRAMRFSGKIKDEDGNWTDMDVTSIVTPDSVISVNIMKDKMGNVSKEGKKWSNPAIHYAASYAKLSEEKKKEYRRISSEEKTRMEFNGMLLNFGMGTKKKVAGYSCDSVQVMTMDMCFLEGSPIPIEGTAMIYDFIAKKVTPNAKVSAKHFQGPSGVKIELDPDRDESSRQMAVMFVENAVKMAGVTSVIKGIFGGGGDDDQGAKPKGKSAPPEEEKSTQPEDEDDAGEKDTGQEAKETINKGLNKLKSIFGD